LDEQFRCRFDLLIAYWKAKGTCNVPLKVVCNLPGCKQLRLGWWLRSCRELHRTKALPSYRLRLLQQLVDEGKLRWYFEKEELEQQGKSNFCVDDEAWDEKFALLLQYGQANGGNCNIPQAYVCKGADGTDIKLGKWLAKQREQQINGKLRLNRLEKLQDLVDAGKLSWTKLIRFTGIY